MDYRIENGQCCRHGFHWIFYCCEGDVFMSEKLAEVFEQYDVGILGTRKGRGATILTTTEGSFIL